jgi:hypothetical protein
MALSIVNVQGSRSFLGELIQDTFLLIPGTSDYVTNGYVVTALATNFKTIQSAWVSGINAAVATGGTYFGFPTFSLAQVGTSGPGFTGYSQFLFAVWFLNSTGPAYAQVSSGGNLTGLIWEVTVQGN